MSYDDAFFVLQAEQSTQAAVTVVPLVQRLLPTDSVLDVGGGVGAWAAVFKATGSAETHVVDGDYVDRSKLLVEPDEFQALDLTQPVDLGRRYDLCVCLEVGEHLPPEAGPTLVNTLVSHADAILFSAAIPRQGGQDHVNEQWPTYWRPLFQAHDYEPFDLVRPMIWEDDRVGFWYRQNVMIYATGEVAEALRERQGFPFFNVVHPGQWMSRTTEPPPPGIRVSAALLRAALRRRFRSG